jgi:phage FluMu protein Com
MWPFKKKLKLNCPECGNVIKILFRDVRIEQTKKSMKFIYPDGIKCKSCGKVVKFKDIELKIGQPLPF